jgi:hypothetical protein
MPSTDYSKIKNRRTMGVMPYVAKRTPSERFWKRVIKAGPDECWLWDKPNHSRGYGQFGIGWKQYLAHRVSWELANGQPVPEGLEVRHTCDNPPCVNPAHLLIGTASDNMRDMVERDRGPTGDRAPARRYPERMPRGEAHKRSKLTAMQVVTIRARALAGVSYCALGREYGVSDATVRRAVKRVNWAHL